MHMGRFQRCTLFLILRSHKNTQNMFRTTQMMRLGESTHPKTLFYPTHPKTLFLG